LCTFSAVKAVPEHRAGAFSYKQSSQDGYIPKKKKTTNHNNQETYANTERTKNF
jgi:hypothetical protein